VTWLTPWTAVAAAALALPLLILLYMLKLRRRPVRVSAASLWAEAADDLEANVPLRRPRPSWLLLVQALALIALIAALGRPAIDAPADTGARAILLIDVSASMRAPTADDPDATRFDRARERALGLIDRLGDDTGPVEAALIAVASEPVPLTPMTRSRQQLRRALDTLEPTDEPADLAAALELASTLARRAQSADAGDETNNTTRIWLFGDGGYDQNNLAASAEVAFFSTYEPQEGADPDAPPPAAGNVGLVAFAARRDYADPAVVRVLATVAHPTPRERSGTLRLTLDGREITRRSITLPPADPASPTDRLAERAVPFAVTTLDGGLLELAITPGGDLSADDRAALLLSPARAPTVRWIVPHDEAAQTDSFRAWVLGDVLDAMNLGRVDRVPANAPTDTNPDLLIFDRVPLDTDRAAPAIAFIAPDPSQPAEPTRVIAWERDHPALRHAPLDRLIVPEPAALPEPAPGVERTVLARGRTRPLIVEDRAPGVRRILVAFDPVRTDWPLQPGFAVFVAAAVDYLTVRAERDAGRAWRTGQPVTLGASPDARVTDPAGEPVTTTPTAEGLTFRPSAVGVYRLTDAAGERPIPVNLTHRNETAAPTAAELRIAGRTVASASDLAGPVELWRWLVLIAGVLLVLEWFVYLARARV